MEAANELSKIYILFLNCLLIEMCCLYMNDCELETLDLTRDMLIQTEHTVCITLDCRR